MFWVLQHNTHNFFYFYNIPVFLLMSILELCMGPWAWKPVTWRHMGWAGYGNFHADLCHALTFQCRHHYMEVHTGVHVPTHSFLQPVHLSPTFFVKIVGTSALPALQMTHIYPQLFWRSNANCTTHVLLTIHHQDITSNRLIIPIIAQIIKISYKYLLFVSLDSKYKKQVASIMCW